MLVAATDRSSAASYARRCQIEPALTLEKSGLLVSPGRLRATIREAGIDAALVHSKDWRRQSNPQLYEVALALMPVAVRYLADEGSGRVRRVGALEMAARLLRLPIDAVRVTASIAGAGARLTRSKTARPPVMYGIDPALPSERTSVLVVWPGSGGGFGGSLTHISGIVGGLRAHGCRIGLLTCFPPPPQLRTLVDEVAVTPRLPASSRMTGDTEQIGSDAQLRRLGLGFSERLRPAFVYQRHSPFLLAGAEIARARRIPLVLEWNASEVWVREHWQTPFGVERVLDPLLCAIEREVVASAALVAAISGPAADMALTAGATPDRTLVLPNAVDVDDVDACIRSGGARASTPGPTLGWAGSFGSWHGAGVAVEALARMADDVHLVMVGDGAERSDCEALAEALGVTRRIEWTGALRRDDALRLLAGCDILLSPHTPMPDQPFFGSPTKLFEYMALGKPIVASRLGQLAEILEDGVTARLVTPGDADELATAAAEILASPDGGRALGVAARRAVAERHTWNDRVRVLLERLGYVVEASSAS